MSHPQPEGVIYFEVRLLIINKDLYLFQSTKEQNHYQS